jgi:hypothetical protein
MNAEPESPAAAAAAAAAAGGGSSPSSSPRLQAFDTASEVQLMAAQVLQRKQRSQYHHPTAAATVSPHDPLHLLTQPEKGLRARKEQLMSAVGGNGTEGSARVAAAKTELAGVQARLRNALGLREETSEEVRGRGLALFMFVDKGGITLSNS